MSEGLKCECGSDTFSYFGTFVRCPSCLNEYKRVGWHGGTVEYWMRRYNLEKERYDINWEHAPFTDGIVQ